MGALTKVQLNIPQLAFHNLPQRVDGTAEIPSSYLTKGNFCLIILFAIPHVSPKCQLCSFKQKTPLAPQTGCAIIPKKGTVMVTAKT